MSSSSKVAGWQEVRPIRLRTFWGAVDPPLGQKLARDGGALPRASGLWLGWDRLWGPGGSVLACGDVEPKTSGMWGRRRDRVVIGGFLSSRRSDFVSGGEHLEPAGFSFVPKVPLSYDSSSITWLWPAGSPSYLQLQVTRGSLSA